MEIKILFSYITKNGYKRMIFISKNFLFDTKTAEINLFRLFLSVL